MDVQAAAMNGFDYLMKAAKVLTDDKKFITMLEQGKQYLKTRYQRDCKTDSMLSSHNQHFALSDEKVCFIFLNISCFFLILGVNNKKYCRRNLDYAEGDLYSLGQLVEKV